MKNPGTITDSQWQAIESLYKMAAHTYGYVKADDQYRNDSNIQLLRDSMNEVTALFPGINLK